MRSLSARLLKLYFNSIHWKIQLWYSIFLLIILSAFSVMEISSEKEFALFEIDTELFQHAGVLSNALFSELEIANIQKRYADLDEEERKYFLIFTRQELLTGQRGTTVKPGEPIDLASYRPWVAKNYEHTKKQMQEENKYYVLYNPDRTVKYQTDNSPNNLVTPLHSHEVGHIRDKRSRENLREVIHFARFGYAIVVGMDISDHKKIQEFYTTTALYILAAVAFYLFAFIGGWYLISIALRPIKDISEDVERISHSDLSERIDLPNNNSEFRPLITSLNKTFNYLEKSFKQQSQFTADASHELRTPLTVILSQTQVALSKTRSEKEYKMALGACENAASRMKNIVESLLTLARLSTIAKKETDSAFAIHEAIMEVVNVLTPLAAEKKIEITVNSENAHALGAKTSFSTAMSNLISNAIYYSKTKSSIEISCEIDEENAIIAVQDSGIGIPETDLPNIFKRFYRVDKSRNRKSGFAGLGLSITKEAIESLDGDISVSSVVDEGTKFTITLPLFKPEEKPAQEENSVPEANKPEANQ